MTQAKPRTARESVQRAAEIARRYGKNVAADRAVALLDAPFRTGSVVVVGEVKRGKSSLINALIGHRDLLPVDVITCTSAPIRVTCNNSKELVDPIVVVTRGDQHLAITSAQLPQWVTQEGVGVIDPQNETQQPATAALIEVNCPELAGVMLVDTPGVGGLDEHAVTAALHEAKNAGLLLMVCDASTPITKPEMDILARAKKTVGGVVVAVTKTDKNLRRWRAIVDNDRRLIHEHLGIEVPVIGVSSLRAIDAAETVDPSRRNAIAERSGIAELRRQIRAVLSDPETLGAKSAIDSISTTMTGIIHEIEADIKLYQGASEAVVELEEQRLQLEQLREHSTEWEQLFQRDIQITRNQITGEFDQEIEQIRTEWTTRINNEGLRVLRSKPQVFTSQIEAELTDVMERTVSKILKNIATTCEKLFPNNPELQAQVTEAALKSLVPVEIASRDVAKKTKDLVDPSVFMMGMIGAGALSVIIPVAPLAGATWIGVNLAFRAMKNGKQHLIGWIRETTATMRLSTTRMLDTVIATARTEIVVVYRAQLRNQQKQLHTRIEQAQKIAHSSESERKDKLTRLQRNHQIVTATIGELQAHRGKL